MTNQPKTDETHKADEAIEDLDVDPKDAADIKGAAATGKVIKKAVLY